MKVALLGSTGMIGHRVLLELLKCEQIDVVGLSRSTNHKSLIQKFSDRDGFYEGVDMADFKQVELLLEKIKPEVIINAVGITIRKLNQPDSFEKAFQVNTLLPKTLQKWVQKNNARLIHLSTDCVFSGAKGNYTEIDIPDANDVYGKTKFAGEVEGKNCLTLRFSAIGRELESHTELLDWFLQQNNKNIQGHEKAIYTGLTTAQLSEEIVKIVLNHKNLEGLYQISNQAISKYELLCLLKKAYGLNLNIEKIDGKNSNKALLSNKYKEATGFVPRDWSTLINNLINDNSDLYKNFRG